MRIGGCNGIGYTVQPVRCPLRHRGPMGKPEDAPTSDAVACAERKSAVGTGKLLPVQPHLCEGHQRLGDCGLDTGGSKRDWPVQGGNRLLQQQDRVHTCRHAQVEAPQGDCRSAQQVGQLQA